MGLLCFVLDLSSFQPSLLKDLKQYLLELANLYAIRKENKEEIHKCSYSAIALCCIQKNNVSGSNELRIAYHPQENFNLRDFHHAVNSLSTDHLLPRSKAFEFSQSHQQVSCLSTLLTSNGGLYSWGPETIGRKVIMISSFFMENAVSFRKTVMDAADHCVTIEFIQIECENHTKAQWGSLLGSFSESMLVEKVKDFTNSIFDFKNCLFHRVQRDHWSFCSLVKRWLHYIKDDLREPVQAVFIFKDDLVDSTNKIFCNLFPSIMHIEDKFRPCQTCRCHGASTDTVNAVKEGNKKSVCPITGQELDTFDLTENGLKIGLETILLLPSFKKIPRLEPVSAAVAFNIIQCVRLVSLSEDLFFGSSFIILASSNHVTTEGDKTKTNYQTFLGLCQALDSMDCGLICTSSCDVECKFEANLPCFYLLQPAYTGKMLLRRIAASEEYLPIPDSVEVMNTAVPEEFIASINTSLTKLGSQDYNPLNQERGCHTKLNWLVKESLQFRFVPLPIPNPQQNLPINSRNLPIDNHKSVPIQSPNPDGEQNLAIGKYRADQGNLQPDNMRKERHEKMNMSPGLLAKGQIPSILERIEPLRTFNKLNISSTASLLEPVYQSTPSTLHTQAHSISQKSKALMGMKKPLLPFQPSQLPQPSFSPNPTQLKPNFRRIKRSKN